MKLAKLLGAVLGLGLILAAQPGMAADGKKVFKKCKACHTLKEGKHKVGPSLAGIVGRTAGTADGYKKYSKIMKAAGEAGLTWDAASIEVYVRNSTAYLKDYLESQGKEGKGKSKMKFRLKKEEEAKAVVEYIASQ